jgi:hypothetical protein
VTWQESFTALVGGLRPLYKQQTGAVDFLVESRPFLHIHKFLEISMHLNAIKLTLFALLTLPSVWALPLQDDQVSTRDHVIIVRKNTNLAQRDNSRQGGKHKPLKVFYLEQCLGWLMLIILKELKKDKKELNEDDKEKKKAEAEALKAARKKR